MEGADWCDRVTHSGLQLWCDRPIWAGGVRTLLLMGPIHRHEAGAGRDQEEAAVVHVLRDGPDLRPKAAEEPLGSHSHGALRRGHLAESLYGLTNDESWHRGV